MRSFLFLLAYIFLNATLFAATDNNVQKIDNCCQIPSYPNLEDGWNKIEFNGNGDDGSTDEIDIGFKFKFYGEEFTRFYININGNVTFRDKFGTYHTSDLSTKEFPIIAPYWSDIDIRKSFDKDKEGNYISNDAQTGGIYYRKSEGRIQVLWYEVGYYEKHNNKRATFMLTLTSEDKMIDGANVVFCYSKLEFTTGEETLSCNGNSCTTNDYPMIGDKCSNGSGFGGTPSTVGIALGNMKDFFQVGRFDKLQSKGNFKGSYENGDGGCVDYDAVDWLLGNCDLKYNVSGQIWTKILQCNNEYYGFEMSFFSDLFEKNVTLYYDNELIDSFKASSVKRVYNADTYHFVADGEKHTIKVLSDDGDEIETLIEAPKCSLCSQEDFDLSVNGDDLAASYCSNKVLSFSAKPKSGVELTNPKYIWSFSNSESSDMTTPEKTYTVARKETVSVKITSDECKGGIILDREFDIDVCPCSKDNVDIRINGDDLAASYCSNKVLSFSAKPKSGVELTNPKYIWSFSNSESSDMTTPEKTYTVARKESVSVKITSDECKEGITLGHEFSIDICPVDEVCPTEFAPTVGKKYILSGWMHVDGANNEISFEDYGSIKVEYEGSEQVDEGIPSGDIIDGWQRIYKEVLIPEKATRLNFELVSKKDNDCYFDDIRFHPVDASMVSYVYDPVTLRLVAELDNENYATFYEYDEEGAMIRVKKETERGIMTIKEARQGGVKTK